MVDPIRLAENKIEGGPNLANFLKRPEVTLATVLSVDFYFLLSKTSGHPKHLARRSAVENVVLNYLLEWMVEPGLQGGDELLSRYSDKGRKKLVIRKDVRAAIKETVSGMGLPAAKFFNKSLRSGLSTHVIANSMGIVAAGPILTFWNQCSAQKRVFCKLLA